MKAWHSTALALPMVALVACGGGGSTDIEGTITFADRTDPEIVRMISAAGGTEMFQAQSAVDNLGDNSFDPDPNCPTIAIDGDVVTITGGCTTLDGVQIEGTAVATNPTWDSVDYNFGDDTLLEMHGLTITESGFSMTYDGFVRRTDNFATYDADITVTQQGVALRSDLYYHCSGTTVENVSCNVSGSGLELVGVGGATLSGHVEQSGSDFTLEGTDTLTVDINAQRCVGWSIEGTERGMVCAP